MRAFLLFIPKAPDRACPPHASSKEVATSGREQGPQIQLGAPMWCSWLVMCRQLARGSCPGQSSFKSSTRAFWQEAKGQVLGGWSNGSDHPGAGWDGAGCGQEMETSTVLKSRG